MTDIVIYPWRAAVRKPDPSPISPGSASSDHSQAKPEVAVLFGTTEGNIPAFRRAVALAREIDAILRVIVLEEVPSPLEHDTAPVSAELMIRRLWTAVPAPGVESRVQVYRCRNKEQALGRILGAPSIVVIGSESGWWVTEERRLSWLLEKSGQLVLVGATE